MLVGSRGKLQEPGSSTKLAALGLKCAKSLMLEGGVGATTILGAATLDGVAAGGFFDGDPTLQRPATIMEHSGVPSTGLLGGGGLHGSRAVEELVPEEVPSDVPPEVPPLVV
jgi:hypothetical protein